MEIKSNRTIRQEESVSKWRANGGIGTIVAAPGTGKTNISFMIIEKMYSMNKNLRVLVVVPGNDLKSQWEDEIDERGLKNNVLCYTIPSAINNTWNIDLLIIDEIHRIAYGNDSWRIFNCVKARFGLGLTGTPNRNDGLEKYTFGLMPIVDEIPFEEATKNGWISEYVEYRVYFDIDDYEQYEVPNRMLEDGFSFFKRDFALAQRLSMGKMAALERKKYASAHGIPIAVLSGKAMMFRNGLLDRKEFVYSHFKRVELAVEVMKARMGKKTITFSMTQDMAETLPGYAYHSNLTAKERKKIITEYKANEKGIINSISALDTGFNDENIELEIILACTSSEISKLQKIGRCNRKKEGKNPEVFHFVMKNTIDESWANNSQGGREIIPIDENGLRRLLAGKPYNLYYPRQRAEFSNQKIYQ